MPALLGPIEVDAVICALTASKVTVIIPGLPSGIHGTLDRVIYSRGCRVVIGLDHAPLLWAGTVNCTPKTRHPFDRVSTKC